MKLSNVVALVALTLAALSSAHVYALDLNEIGSDLNPEEIIGGVTVAANDPVASSTVMIYGKENGSGFICSGSILANDVVLTAAHCLGQSGNAQLVVVFRTDINGQGPVIQVTRQVRPSDYQRNAATSPTDWDDLGMIQLASPIPAGYAPATILPNASALQNGANVLLAGYGINVPTPPTNPNDDGGAGVLRKVQQNILQSSYGQTEVLVNLRGKGACHGDSGGPAFVQNNGKLYLFGVTSRLTQDDKVANNNTAQDYSCSVDMVYTNILARSAWINSNLKKLHKH